jgi:hypothetical protein
MLLEVAKGLVRQLHGPVGASRFVHINFEKVSRGRTYAAALEALLFHLHEEAKTMRRKPPPLPGSGTLGEAELEERVLEFFQTHNDERIFYTWDEVRSEIYWARQNASVVGPHSKSRARLSALTCYDSCEPRLKCLYGTNKSLSGFDFLAVLTERGCHTVC